MKTIKLLACMLVFSVGVGSSVAMEQDPGSGKKTQKELIELINCLLQFDDKRDVLGKDLHHAFFSFMESAKKGSCLEFYDLYSMFEDKRLTGICSLTLCKEIDRLRFTPQYCEDSALDVLVGYEVGIRFPLLVTPWSFSVDERDAELKVVQFLRESLREFAGICDKYNCNLRAVSRQLIV